MRSVEHSAEFWTLMGLAVALDAGLVQSVFKLRWPGAWGTQRPVQLRIDGGPNGPYYCRDSRVVTLFVVAGSLIAEFGTIHRPANRERFKFELAGAGDLDIAKDLILRRFQSGSA